MALPSDTDLLDENRDNHDLSKYVAQVLDLSQHYGKTTAVDSISLNIPKGSMVGMIGPDGVGKSSLLSIIAGAREVQQGQVWVLGGSMLSKEHRDLACPRIAYMPQGLGKNLYATLSVEENLQFFGRLFGSDATERRKKIDQLTKSTGLYPFLDRQVGDLSGGMKQKVGLCCSLIHDPDLLILDEPTTGVDPLSRALFWELIAKIRLTRPRMSVIVATSYMEEAQSFDWLVAMNAGRIMATGSPAELLSKTNSTSLDEVFVDLLPKDDRAGYVDIVVPKLLTDASDIAIEAQDLTKQWGNFTAVSDVSFKIRRGEIFGFLGSNGCGKTTTIRMLTGLLNPTKGKAFLFGTQVDANDIHIRQNLGYMSQAFSLYTELSVIQNLELQARLFHIPEDQVSSAVERSIAQYNLEEYRNSMPADLPLGIRQRLSLAAAVIHKPKILILDEPTSGVDPVSRNVFWRSLIDLSRNDGITIFITTHFMSEALLCDRISLMNAGQVIITDTPGNVISSCSADNMQDAFLYYLERATGERLETSLPKPNPSDVQEGNQTSDVQGGNQTIEKIKRPMFSLERAWSYCLLETKQLLRDPIRCTLALLGTSILMLVMGFGITLDVKNLRYAVLDRDQSEVSLSYKLNIAGSKYFIEQDPIKDYADMDRRLRSGELSLALEIPDGFGRDSLSGQQASIGGWLDGAMPIRAETGREYVQAIHSDWVAKEFFLNEGNSINPLSSLAIRYRYNQDVESLPAMVPAVIPLLLLMIPAMLTALSVVREKEIGTITNLYVTPVSRSEFLLGKQFPYICLSMVNFIMLVLMAIWVFGVPLKGSFITLLFAALIFSMAATGIGLLASAFTNSQIAAIFVALIITLVPSIQYGGLTNPVSALEGTGYLIGKSYPISYFLTISRGVFNKGLGWMGLSSLFWPMIISVPVILLASVGFLKKQEA